MNSSDRLYQLLPAIYRIRDAEQGEQLRALLSLISDELASVEADIQGLYENWFVETSDEWVVPYIGDLLGVRRSVGRALLLAGSTTVAGFGSLAFSSNAGMASLGLVCALGITLSLLVAVYLLPVWWQAWHRR